MMLATKPVPGTASLRDEAEIPLVVSWPPFKAGSALQASSFAEEVELIEALPNAWSTSVLEKALFPGQVLAVRPEPSLWDKLAQLRSMIPAEELQKYPTDGARNLDKYMYGSTNAG